MLQTTVNTALYGDVGDYAGHFIYLYRDGDVIFYVGRSSDPINRLQQHMGLDHTYPNSSYPSNLGRVIQDNLPESVEWTLEVYTLEDCVPLIEQYASDVLPHYLNLLSGEKEFIESVAASRSDIERRFISDEKWMRDCKEGFQLYIYKRLGDIAEQAMFDRYGPHLNYILNTARVRPLPARYVKERIANEGAKYGKVE